MKKLTLAFVCIQLSLVAQTSETVPLSAVMLPSNEVPATTINASGSAAILVHVVRDAAGKVTSGSVDFGVSYNFPGSLTITGLHIHEGRAGANGPVIIDTEITGTKTVVDNTGKAGVTRQAQIKPDNAAGIAALERLLQDPNQFYVNLHTPEFPGGVIRGQLQRDEVLVLLGQMSNLNEVPVVSDVTASGLGAAHVFVTRNELGAITRGRVIFDVNYSFPDKQTFTGLHIHKGGADVAGPVTIGTPLSGTNSVQSPDNGSGNLRYVVSVDSSNRTGLDTLEGLFKNPGGYYINLHTSAKAGGVIRAQLRPTTRLAFPVALLPSNEVPPITGLSASGPSEYSVYVLRNADGTIPAAAAIFDVNYRFPGPAEFTGMHIHNGASGVNGTVTIDSGISGSNSVSSADGFGNLFYFVNVNSPAGLATVNSIVSNPELHYLNLHTRVNPNGVIRAQLAAANTALPVVNAITSATSAVSITTLSPGGLITIYGTNMSKTTSDLRGLSSQSLPVSLNGVRVTIGGKDAPLLFVSPNQINAQVPADIPAGPQTVTVTMSNGTSANFVVTVAPAAPAIFFDPVGGVVVRNSDFALVRPETPARAGDILVIYATGLGATTPAIPPGTLASGPPFAMTAPVTITVGGQNAPVIYSLAAPGFAGLYQIAFRMPSGVSGGNAPLVIRVNNVASNTVNIAAAPDIQISDPVGDFLTTYPGPKGGDLDVVKTQVTFTGTEFVFSGTMNAPIGTTKDSYYVWGVDRGLGNKVANFAEIGLPNVIFDLVVFAMEPGGPPALVNDLNSGIATPLPPTAVTITGNTIVVRVPLSLLPSNGLKPEQYMWNLWPRWGGIPFGDAQISDFAPDNRNAVVLSNSLVVDPIGDFLTTYVGPKGGDLDVVSTQVTFTGTEFVFSGTMNAPIGTTKDGYYVWGVDRGLGNKVANFEQIGLPDVIFDLVVFAREPGGPPALVNDLNSGIATPLPPTAVTITGNTIVVRVPMSLLPSNGLSPEQYMWNLWPRWGGVPFGDAQISDFAPNTRNSIVTTPKQ